MKSNQGEFRKKLVIKKQTIRELKPAGLRNVVGGVTFDQDDNTCVSNSTCCNPGDATITCQPGG